MYYYLAVSYYVHDMQLDEASDLAGPFTTEEERQESIDLQIAEDWDLETDVVNITLLEVRDGAIVRTESGLALDLEGDPDGDEFEVDDEYDDILDYDDYEEEAA